MPEAAKNAAKQPLSRDDNGFAPASHALSRLTSGESSSAASQQPENQSVAPLQRSEREAQTQFSRLATEPRPTQAISHDAQRSETSEHDTKAEAPPIVRIRIGRVEVRAAKAKASPAQKIEPEAGVAHRSRSLSDYLRKREAGDDE